jgi:hypothetical protein
VTADFATTRTESILFCPHIANQFNVTLQTLGTPMPFVTTQSGE